MCMLSFFCGRDKQSKVISYKEKEDLGRKEGRENGRDALSSWLHAFFKSAIACSCEVSSERPFEATISLNSPTENGT